MNQSLPFHRRWLAYTWYAWGLSLSYWGVQLGEPRLFAAAIGSFNRALAAWPAFGAAYFRRGMLYSREQNQHDQGIEDLSRAIQCSPQRAEYYLHRGLIARFYGDPHAAMADLRHFLALAPQSNWRVEAERQLAQLECEQ